MSIEELTVNATQATEALESATKDFEAQRGTASITDLGKLANAVTSATRKAESTARELADFALVGIYEGVKSQLLKLGDKLLTGADIATLLEKNVSTVTVSIPLTSDGIEEERISVNTLGKRTVVRSSGGGNGTRSAWEMRGPNGESMTCREFLETHGEVLGAHKDGGATLCERVLAEPARYGLSDYAARAGQKMSPTWERVKKDA